MPSREETVKTLAARFAHFDGIYRAEGIIDAIDARIGALRPVEDNNVDWFARTVKAERDLVDARDTRDHAVNLALAIEKQRDDAIARADRAEAALAAMTGDAQPVCWGNVYPNGECFGHATESDAREIGLSSFVKEIAVPLYRHPAKARTGDGFIAGIPARAATPAESAWIVGQRGLFVAADGLVVGASHMNFDASNKLGVRITSRDDAPTRTVVGACVMDGDAVVAVGVNKEASAVITFGKRIGGTAHDLLLGDVIPQDGAK